MRVFITAYHAISHLHYPEPPQEKSFSPFALTSLDLDSLLPKNKNRRYLSRAAKFGAAAAHQCILKANLTQDEQQNAALVVGTGPYLETEAQEPNERQALWLLKHLPNTLSSYISLTHGIQGESLTLSTACASGLQAIGMGYRLVQSGDANHAFVGAGDSRLHPNALNGYERAGALYMPPRDTPYAPLCQNPRGFIPGEGGAFFLLESEVSMHSRGATPLCEIIGFGASSDAHSMTAPNPSGETQTVAIKKALQCAKLEPSQITRISCHGTGTPLNDEMESKLLSSIFNFPIDSISTELTSKNPDAAFLATHKQKVGHFAAAAGAIELALELERLTRLNRGSMNPQNVLLQNFGFGGQNAVLVIQSV